MIELRILNGKMAGQSVVARHFPFLIGRAPNCDLCLLEDGVWDEHLRLVLEDQKLMLRTVGPGGQLEVNHQKVSEAPFKVGDELQLGSVKMECGCSVMEQYSLRWVEQSLWLGGAVLMFLECVVILLLCF